MKAQNLIPLSTWVSPLADMVGLQVYQRGGSVGPVLLLRLSWRAAGQHAPVEEGDDQQREAQNGTYNFRSMVERMR